MAKVVITGMGHYHPENVLDNRLFDALDIGSTAAWIEERTGIEERRSVLTPTQVLALRHGQTTARELLHQGKIMSLADLAERAWPMALDRSGLTARQVAVGTALSGTSTPDFDAPANACAIAGQLGLSCPAYDVNSACSSFVVGLHVARHLAFGLAPQAIALFNPDRFTTRINYQDRSTCILWGDACSVAILEVDPAVGGLEIVDTLVISDPERYRAVTIGEGADFAQDGKAVQRFAITKTVAVTQELLARQGLTPQNLTYFIGHQANLHMLATATTMLGLAPHQHLHNAAKFGNQGGAGAPAVLSSHWHRLNDGDLIAVSVVGAGLTWSSVLLRKVGPRS